MSLLRRLFCLTRRYCAILTGECECYPETNYSTALPWTPELESGVFAKPNANGHAILGITPAKPEHERAFLLGWILSLLLITAVGIGFVLLLMPRIMR
jgi:hypothetical protein